MCDGWPFGRQLHEAWSLNAFIAGKYARGDEALHHVIEVRGGDCVAGNLGTDFSHRKKSLIRLQLLKLFQPPSID